ncbi:MAG: carboxypeptidase-like regulatory domain-containing protein [Candidatus Thiodiazotropha sp.]
MKQISRHYRSMFTTLLLTLCWQGSVLAVTLSGIVMEEATALADVEVMLVNKHNGVVVDRGYTDADGAFRFTVKPGIYDVGAFKFEYVTDWNRGISIQGENTSIEIELEPAAFSEAAPSSVDCE